jgi:catechol 2,3-dioxygenase-like lactoylglutathione lyase family enzyme
MTENSGNVCSDSGKGTMTRGIDHIVHAARDLDAAVALYRGLGFTVGSRNTHPRAWGTQNHIIQLPDTFIELLAVADESGMAPHTPKNFSFGAFNRDFLKRGQGLSMLVLKGQGAPDAEDFRAKGIGDFDLYNFEREGRRPDGSAVKVAFSLAFARDAAAPDIGAFTCQHHYPENFWNPEFQKHANIATGVAGIVAVADEPERHRAFMQVFAGGEAARADGGFAIATPRGTIELTTPAAFTHRFGVKAPDVSRSARLAAIRFTVADASLLQAAPELAGIAGIYAGNPTVIGADDALGAVIIFEPSR